MNRYEIRCTEEQTRKALEHGAPIEISADYSTLINGVPYEIPTAEQMIGFLRSKGIKFHFDDDTNYWHVSIDSEPLSIGYGTDKNKELAAIDAALDYLSQRKEE